MKATGLWQVVIALALAALLSHLFLNSQVDRREHQRVRADIQMLLRHELHLRRLLEQAYRGGVYNFDGLGVLSSHLRRDYRRLLGDIERLGAPSLANRAERLLADFRSSMPDLMRFERALAVARVVDLYLPQIGQRFRNRLHAHPNRTRAHDHLLDALTDIQLGLSELAMRVSAEPEAADELLRRLAALPLHLDLPPGARRMGESFIEYARTRVQAVVLASRMLGRLGSDDRERGLDGLARSLDADLHARERTAARYRLALFVVAGLLLAYLAWVFFSLQRVSEDLRRLVRDLDFHKFVTDEHAIVSATDADGRITYVNDHFCRLTGYMRDELIGNTHRIFRSGMHGDTFYRTLWETISGGAVWRGTLCNRSRDGSLRWFETTIVPRLDEQGRPEAYFAIRTDVTDKVRAERQVAWLARIPEENPDPVMRLDRGAGVLYANEAAAQVIMRLEDDPTQQCWPEGVLRILEQGRPGELECRVGERHYRFHVVPVVSEGYVNVYGHDITERHKAELQLSWQARHDALTGLANRHAFEVLLDEAIETARIEGRNSMLLYLDLDQFKVVNDTCGHVAGDELLRQLGRELAGAIRANDELARLGGDEFAVLLRHCPVDIGLEIADKLRRLVADFRFRWEDRSFRLGVSIGVVEITADSQGRSEVLAAADVACYAAKDSGRNRVHLYRLDDDQAAQRRDEMQWAVRIPQALADDRFMLMAQAVVPLREDSGLRGHYEVLVRMLDDEGRPIPPGAFIPAAERYDLMPAIDRWVIEHVFEALRDLKARGEDLSRWRFAINLCGPSLGDGALLDAVARWLRELSLPPGQVSFEITETAAVGNLSDAVEFIQKLKALGCEIALDDFGSGLSSFAYLKNLPVDFLKIDGAFVKDMLEDPIDAAMIEAINQIGHVMEIRTIAEFVENEGTRRRLSEIGVDFAQGFGIARPVPLDALLSGEIPPVT